MNPSKSNKFWIDSLDDEEIIRLKEYFDSKPDMKIKAIRVQIFRAGMEVLLGNRRARKKTNSTKTQRGN